MKNRPLFELQELSNVARLATICKASFLCGKLTMPPHLQEVVESPMWMFLYIKISANGTSKFQLTACQRVILLYYFFFERQLTHAHVPTRTRLGIRDPSGHSTNPRRPWTDPKVDPCYGIAICSLHESNPGRQG